MGEPGVGGSIWLCLVRCRTCWNSAGRRDFAALRLSYILADVIVVFLRLGGFVWLEFEVVGLYTQTDEVFVGKLDVIGVLGRQRFCNELCFRSCG